MTRKKTQQEFVQELARINNNVKILGNYERNRYPIACVCLICKYEWAPSGSSLLRGHGCPKCVGNLRKTHAQYLQELAIKNPAVVVVAGQYQSGKKKLTFGCVDCGHSWVTAAGSPLQEKGCIKCGFKKMAKAQAKDPHVFLDELKLVHMPIEPLEPYKKAHEKIWARCSLCSFSWQISPNNILRGRKCPACVKKPCFRPNKAAVFYLLELLHQEKIYLAFGITNNYFKRMKKHRLVFKKCNISLKAEHFYHFEDGRKAQALELAIKQDKDIPTKDILCMPDFKEEATFIQFENAIAKHIVFWRSHG